MMTWWGGWVGCALLLVSVSSPAVAQAPASRDGEARRPTTVTADHLEVRRKEHRAIYTGNVVAKTTDLTVMSDRMEFDFDEKMEGVERMVAVGNVHVSRSDGTKAVSEQATYDIPLERVVLEGNPRAWRDGNMVSGRRITLFVVEDRQVVEGDENERVTAVIYPKRPSEQAR